MRLASYVVGLATSIILFSALDARAMTTFFFDGTCDSRCGDFGASIGDSISGSITLSDADAVPNNVFAAADVIAFNMEFGSFSFDYPDAPIGLTPTPFDGGTVNSSGSGFDRLLLRGGPTPDVFFRFPDTFNTDRWRVALCQLDCIGATNVLAVAIGSGTWTSAPIPEPSAGVLFGVGAIIVSRSIQRRRG